MNLFQLFLRKLEEEGLSKDDIRFLNAQEILRRKIQSTTINKFSKNFGYNHGTISHMLNGKRAIPLSLLKGDSNLTNLKLLIKNSNVAIIIPTRLTKELAYLVGFLRDGTVSEEKNNEYCCAFYNNNFELLKTVQHFVGQLFGLKPKISKFGDTYGVRIRSRTLFLFFKLIFEAPQKQATWNTPLLIKLANNKIKQWYVGGFFDAEGGVPHFEKNIKRNKKCLYVKFVQNNKEPLEFIKKYLESQGIKTRSVYRERTEWVLKVSNSSIPKFAKFVITFHPQKADRLTVVSKLLS